MYERRARVYVNEGSRSGLYYGSPAKIDIFESFVLCENVSTRPISRASPWGEKLQHYIAAHTKPTKPL